LSKAFIFLLIAFFEIIPLASYAQTSPEAMQYNYSLELYQKKTFKAARFEFSKYLIGFPNANMASIARYYRASAAVKAGQDDGENLMQTFVDQYPDHPMAGIAFLELGDYQFTSGNYTRALHYYEKSATVDLSYLQLFQIGFTQLSTGDDDKALETFAKLEHSFSQYEYDAAYFQGYIHHGRKEYQQAGDYLKIAFKSERYQNPAAELYTSILYQNGAFQELIDMAGEEKDIAKNPMVLNYLADAHYALAQYDMASVRYQELTGRHARFRSENNYFRAGYSFYQIDKQDQAIGQFKRAAISDDTVGAYASYYLGMIYSEQGSLLFAANSFANTAKYKTPLTEDALFYYGKILTDDQKYTESIVVLDQYQSAYPDGKYTAEVSELISNAYLLTNNYDLALAHIERLDQLTKPLKETYQRVSFLKAMRLFNDKKFTASIAVFQKSLIHSTNETLTQQTYFWIAEALSVEGKYRESLFYYRSVSSQANDPLYAKAQYGLAYAYFNNREYESSLDTFSSFEEAYEKDLKNRYLADALLRMGDCYFALKDYVSGLKYYQKADKAGNSDKSHIYFQSGLLNRYLDKDIIAKAYFEKLKKEIPDSEKADQAQFQIAQIDYENENEQGAIGEFQEFLADYPTSSLVPFALLNQAVAYDNQGNGRASTTNYKAILDRFPRHTAANSALLGLQEKYNNGQFDQFDSYLQKYKRANPNSEALENIEYENARTSFYSQKYDVAISGFNSFIQAYPESSLVANAIYFLGDAYFRKNDLSKALEYFNEIVNESDFSKYSKVLYRMATINSRFENYSLANQYFYRLSSASHSQRDVVNLQNGLMQNYLALNAFDSVIFYGNTLLSNPRVPVLIEANASLHIGKAEYEKGNGEAALRSFLTLVTHSPDDRGAEAYYYISKIYHDQGQSDRALESLFVLTNNFKMYDRWVGKAYLLMADIYAESDEIFQAKATLQSLLENSSIEEIKQVAAEKLRTLNEELIKEGLENE